MFKINFISSINKTLIHLNLDVENLQSVICQPDSSSSAAASLSLVTSYFNDAIGYLIASMASFQQMSLAPFLHLGQSKFLISNCFLGGK